MKKAWIGILTLVLVMGIGTSVYATSADEGDTLFERMLPFAKQMHPDWTDSQIKDMVDNCSKHNNSQNRSEMMSF